MTLMTHGDDILMTLKTHGTNILMTLMTIGEDTLTASVMTSDYLVTTPYNDTDKTCDDIGAFEQVSCLCLYPMIETT